MSGAPRRGSSGRAGGPKAPTSSQDWPRRKRGRPPGLSRRVLLQPNPCSSRFQLAPLMQGTEIMPTPAWQPAYRGGRCGQASEMPSSRPGGAMPVQPEDHSPGAAGHQPVEDPLHRVHLPARRIQIRPQHLINNRLEQIQARFRGRSFLRGSGHADASASRTSRRGTAVYGSADHVSELVAASDTRPPSCGRCPWTTWPTSSPGGPRDAGKQHGRKNAIHLCGLTT